MVSKANSRDKAVGVRNFTYHDVGKTQETRGRMPTLNERIFRALLDVAAHLQTANTMDEFVDTLLKGLLDLVPGELAGWNQIDLQSNEVSGRGFPPDAAESLYPLVSKHLMDHPLIAYYSGTGSTTSARISDVCSIREWAHNPLYLAAFQPLGLTYQIGVPLLATPSTLSAAAISRGGSDFSARDKAVLDTLAPLATTIEKGLRWRLSLESELRALDPGRARLLVSKDGVVIQTDDPEMAKTFLPTPLDEVERNAERFSVAQLRRDSDRSDCPVTSRQLEAIQAVADGSTVFAASRKLGVSPRTLDKHLQRTYAILGVSGRVAALSKLRQHGWLDWPP